MAPRISIVSPSYQQADYLEECLRSVQQQEGAEVEHIVVDGGSTDASPSILERHADHLAWWCSEKDKGQSEAINKGLAHATGDIFNWLNSDDALLPGALRTVSEAFAADPDLLVFGGRLVHRKGDREEVFLPQNDASDVVQLHTAPVIAQPATFFRMEVLRTLGGVDPALRYVMDLELWWRFLFHFGSDRVRFVPVELAMFRLHDESKTVSAHAGFLQETAELLHGMCEAVGLADLAQVLRVAHAPVPGLRGVPVPREQQDMVRRMAVHFLLKWNGRIHAREQFMAMKALQRCMGSEVPRYVADGMKERWMAVQAGLRAGSWTAYRIRRKLDHLRP